MAARPIDPRAVKLHRSYDAGELAAVLRVHKNTVRHWQRAGLKPIDGGRPIMFQGGDVREFLSKRNASRKSPCPPGTLYCFRCRAPRPPALAMVDYVPINARSGNIRAFCAQCETMMHRRAPVAGLAAIMPGCDVQFAEAETRLSGGTSSPLNCDFRGKGPMR